VKPGSVKVRFRVTVAELTIVLVKPGCVLVCVTVAELMIVVVNGGCVLV